jgi:hypothetical protein
MGPILRKEDPQKTPIRNPVPQKDEKGVMILGSRMTRAQLLDYIRTKRLEAEEKRNHQPPPQPMTPRMKAQIELEMAAGARLVEKFAALEAQRRDAANRAEQRGNTVTAPVITPAGQDANLSQPREVANEADAPSHAKSPVKAERDAPR